jgi:hypothetical protein
MPELREVFLFRLEANPPYYMWSGVGDLVVQGDVIAPGETLYRGFGVMIDLPAIQQLINGTAGRDDFTISGIDAETLALAGDEDVRGSTVRIGSLALSSDNQPYGMVEWEYEGLADVIFVESSVDQSGNKLRSVSLSVGSADTGRSRSDLAFFTDAEQRKRSPDDAFFDHVGQISSGVTRRFGGS